MQKKWMLVWMLAISITAAACAAAAPEPTPLPALPVDLERGQVAMVDEIDVMIMESFPVQINVVVRGNLPDGCTYLDEVVVQRSGNIFEMTFWTVRDPEAMCTMALVPFEEIISLDVLGLEAGEYMVAAQDQSAAFTLDVDNILEE